MRVELRRRRHLADQGGEAAEGTSGLVAAVKSGDGTIGYADESQAGGLGIAAIKVGEEFNAPSAEGAAQVLAISPRTEGRADVDMAIDVDRTTTESGAYPLLLTSYLIACQTYDDAERRRRWSRASCPTSSPRRASRPRPTRPAPRRSTPVCPMRQRASSTRSRLSSLDLDLEHRGCGGPESPGRRFAASKRSTREPVSAPPSLAPTDPGPEDRPHRASPAQPRRPRLRRHRPRPPPSRSSPPWPRCSSSSPSRASRAEREPVAPTRRAPTSCPTSARWSSAPSSPPSWRWSSRCRSPSASPCSSRTTRRGGSRCRWPTSSTCSPPCPPWSSACGGPARWRS